jgi:hypothetical protein
MDPPQDVIDFFRSLAATLADADRTAEDANLGVPRHATEFLAHFDPAMPGYDQFRAQIEEMVGAGEVAANIDFIDSAGNDRKRTLDLDWVLHCEGQNPKRAIVKCTIEKRGKKWKIVSISPIEFFKRE